MDRHAVLFALWLAFGVSQFWGSAAQAGQGGASGIRVVLDDNYPPYTFRNSAGEVEGYLIDIWKLWEKKTGIGVQIQAYDWSKAQALMKSREADVIDTIFRTPARVLEYDFTPPYADIPVSIYAHADIGGLVNEASLRGFLVGVKAGDSCVDHLQGLGVTTMERFDSYQLLVDAVANGRIKVFCLDDPPANYLLYRAGIHQSFHRAFTLYSGQFHRAVHKGDTEVLNIVDRGFAAITAGEHQALLDKWLGTPLGYAPYVRYLGYGLVVTFGLGVLTVSWLVILRREVRRRTIELAAERTRLRTLFATIPDLVWLKDPDGVYLACNHEFERALGAREADIVGRTDYDLVDKDRAEFFRQKDLDAAAAGKPTTNEETITYASDGRKAVLETTKTPMFDAAGHLTGILGVGHDITERKQDEEVLRQHRDHLEELVRERTLSLETVADRAEAANRAKSTFLANMSHELRTPLTSVIGFSQLMVNDPTLGHEHKRQLAIINRSGTHLLALINDVLELSKIEAGEMKLERNPTDPSEVITSTVEMVRGRAEQKKLVFAVRCPESIANIITDRAKLSQVLLNLLSNAVKFTAQGSVLLEVSETPAVNGRVRLDFVIADSGIGIDIAEQEAIFDPFVQSGQFKDQIGTGLGLSISRQFVRMMGGDLTVKSKSGRGSTFHFFLTAETCGAVEAGRSVRSCRVLGVAEGRGGQRILVAEDAPSIRLLLCNLLVPLGFDVVEVEDGVAAVAAVQDMPPDLVIMDWRMPKVDGIEATRRIRAMANIEQPKIIMLTASAFEEQRLIAMAGGADDFLRKPFEQADLFALLEQHLGICFERDDGVAAAGHFSSPLAELTASDFDILPPELRAALAVTIREMNQVKLVAALERLAHDYPDLAPRIQAMVDVGKFIALYGLLAGGSYSHINKS